MAKLNKHAAIIDQLHSIVHKQAEAQSTVVGTPGQDTKPASPTPSTETVNKNEVKPEDNKNEIKQDPSKEEAGKVVSDGAVKSSSELSKLSEDILSLLKKHSEGVEAQTNVAGTPGQDTKPASPTPSTETVNKNEVKPEDNKNEIKQDPSKEEAGKTVSDAAIKTSSVSSDSVVTPVVTSEKVAQVISDTKVVDEKMASKIASYNLGASLIYDLVKSGSIPTKSAADVALLKEAGRRDMDILITQMANQIKHSSTTSTPLEILENEKVATDVAEQAGAAYFDELYKNASNVVLTEKVAALEQKLTAVEQAKTTEQLAKEAAEKVKTQSEWEANLVVKVAAATAELIEKKLKNESTK